MQPELGNRLLGMIYVGREPRRPLLIPGAGIMPSCSDTYVASRSIEEWVGKKKSRHCLENEDEGGSEGRVGQIDEYLNSSGSYFQAAFPTLSCFTLSSSLFKSSSDGDAAGDVKQTYHVLFTFVSLAVYIATPHSWLKIDEL